MSYFKLILLILFSPAYGIDALKLTEVHVVQKLYQIMKDIHDLLTINQIDYWVDGGTLLGAVRHQGLIAWDDDLDIAIHKKDEVRFLQLIPILYSHNYKIQKMHFGIKIYPSDGTAIENCKWKYPYLDVFFMVSKKDRIYYLTYHEDEPKRNGEFNFMQFNEIYPLKKYKFGPLEVFGPNNPFGYLDTWYGNDWRDFAYKSYDHSLEIKLEKIKIPLNDQLRKPALPFKPLNNNFVNQNLSK